MGIKALAKELDRVNETRSYNQFLRQKRLYLNPPDNAMGEVAYRKLLTAASNLHASVDLVPVIDPDEPDILGQTKAEVGIRLKERKNKTSLAATLAHELAHWVAHNGPRWARVPPGILAEIQAESSAYLVLSQLGIDFGIPSAGYLSGYGVTGSEILENKDVIERTASTILKAAA